MVSRPCRLGAPSQILPLSTYNIFWLQTSCIQATETVPSIQAWSVIREKGPLGRRHTIRRKEIICMAIPSKMLGIFSYVNSRCLDSLPYDCYLPLDSINLGYY